MTAVLQASRCMPSVAVLALLVEQRQLARARSIHQTQLLWVIGAQLSALRGVPFDMPDYFALFPAAPRDRRDADAIRRDVLTRVQEYPHRKGATDGKSV